jgi:hypothetical protein
MINVCMHLLISIGPAEADKSFTYPTSTYVLLNLSLSLFWRALHFAFIRQSIRSNCITPICTLPFHCHVMSSFFSLVSSHCLYSPLFFFLRLFTPRGEGKGQGLITLWLLMYISMVLPMMCTHYGMFLASYSAIHNWLVEISARRLIFLMLPRSLAVALHTLMKSRSACM